MNKTILLIGNGFDQQSGLKTCYKDYLSYEKSTVFRWRDTFFHNNFDFNIILDDLKRINIEEINFWEVYLLYVKYRDLGEDWANVEQQMERYLHYSFNVDYREAGDSLLEEIEKIFKDGNGITDSIPAEDNRRTKQSRNLWCHFLMNQLNDYEELYGNYIDACIKDLSYANCAKNLYESIKHNLATEDIYVYSFNYTTPWKAKDRNDGGGLSYCWGAEGYMNVHGYTQDKNLEIRPIFGVSEIQNSGTNQNFYKFIKSERILQTQKKHPKYVELNGYVNRDNLLGKFNQENFDALAIYGHSLSSVDGEHFKYIFNKIKHGLLSEKEKTIVVFYSIYGDVTQTREEKKLKNSLTALLGKYFEEADAKDLIQKKVVSFELI